MIVAGAVIKTVGILVALILIFGISLGLMFGRGRR